MPVTVVKSRRPYQNHRTSPVDLDAMARDFLAIEISQGSEGTRCEKAAASILNGALHAALFIAPRRAAGPGWRSGSGPRVPRSGDGSGWHRRGAPEPRCGDCRSFVPLRVLFTIHV